MPIVWPLHYALSEALIAGAGLYAVQRCWPKQPWFAIGLAAVALAGLVGAIRILGRMTGPIVDLHALLSRSGSLFGISAMVAVMLWQGRPLPTLGGAVAVTALGALIPDFQPLLFAALLIGGSMLAYRRVAARRWLAAMSFALLFMAAAASMALQPASAAAAWHVFHVLVALWIIMVTRYVARPSPDGEG